jgi:hypothetical protein
VCQPSRTGGHTGGQQINVGTRSNRIEHGRKEINSMPTPSTTLAVFHGLVSCTGFRRRGRHGLRWCSPGRPLTPLSESSLSSSSLWVSAAPDHDGARGLVGASGTLRVRCGPQQTPPNEGSPTSTSFGPAAADPHRTPPTREQVKEKQPKVEDKLKLGSHTPVTRNRRKDG